MAPLAPHIALIEADRLEHLHERRIDVLSVKLVLPAALPLQPGQKIIVHAMIVPAYCRNWVASGKFGFTIHQWVEDPPGEQARAASDTPPALVSTKAHTKWSS